MENSVFIKIESSRELFERDDIVFVDLESIIVYSVYKYCVPDNLSVNFVFCSDKPVSKDTFAIAIKDDSIVIKEFDKIPWQASSCCFPVVKFDDTVITGMCAVTRHICKYRTSAKHSCEHDEGLLGFRNSCLQAPNEVSVWTKFCELDLLKTTKQVLRGESDDNYPVNVARFENHLKKPVRVHNVYKIARSTASTQNKNSSLNDEKGDIISNLENLTLSCGAPDLENRPQEKAKRESKNRKWKSKQKEAQLISSSTPIEQLNVSHEFAEGPFLTLADLVLYPCYQLMIDYYGEAFSVNMPATAAWMKTLKEIEGIESVTDILKPFLSMNKIKKSVENSIITSPVSDVSLYKCDPKRHNPKKRLFTKECDIETALSTLKEGMELSVRPNNSMEGLDWDSVPAGANPKAGHLPDKRMERKCQQLENLAIAVLNVATKGDLIVDFCSGSGHLGILVAHLLPECTVILLENKEQSLMRARDRVHEMRLSNVYFFQCNLDFYIGKFDIGLALHACGIASDLVLDKCLRANAKFIICPCCYGSLHSTDRFQYPRSLSFSSVPLEQYMCLGHAADQTHSEHPLALRGARCMAVIDSDRARLAQESGYRVELTRLKPLTCTPKNNLLIGVPN